MEVFRLLWPVSLGLLATGLSGCVTETPVVTTAPSQAPAKAVGASATATKTASHALSERDCLIRAMYFESNRSSDDGLMAVGTVVMNRMNSPRYPDTICEVVAQPGQFAANAMTASLSPAELPRVERAADAILSGQHYKPVGNAMYFHNAGITIPYSVKYTTIAGGNAFYEKVARTQVVASANAAPGIPAADSKPASTQQTAAAFTGAVAPAPASQ